MTELNKDTQTLDLLKLKLGIKSDARDTILNSVLDSVKAELEEVQGLILDMARADILMFVVDYAYFRYTSRDQVGAMPQHLRFRLHNLVVNSEVQDDLPTI